MNTELLSKSNQLNDDIKRLRLEIELFQQKIEGINNRKINVPSWNEYISNQSVYATVNRERYIFFLQMEISDRTVELQQKEKEFNEL